MWDLTHRHHGRRPVCSFKIKLKALITEFKQDGPVEFAVLHNLAVCRCEDGGEQLAQLPAPLGEARPQVSRLKMKLKLKQQLHLARHKPQVSRKFQFHKSIAQSAPNATLLPLHVPLCKLTSENFIESYYLFHVQR